MNGSLAPSSTLSLRMLMSGGGPQNVESLQEPEEAADRKSFDGLSSSTSSTSSTSASTKSPTLNFNLISFLCSAFLVTLLLSNVNGAYGHPLRSRDVTESNNNLLSWWLSGSERSKIRQMDDGPQGLEVAVGKTADRVVKGLDSRDDNIGLIDTDDGGEGALPLPLPELEDTSRSNQRTGLILMSHPRRKKGLSYLSKFYSEALLHHPAGVGGNSSSSKEAQYFGERYGLGGGSGGISGISTSSGEHSKFPSNIRRKLSFYPPLTLMTPWRSIIGGSTTGGISGSSGGGRGSSLRLRWGK